MTLNNIANKLLKKNIKQYSLLFFCIVLTTSFLTSIGLILFGKTVQETLVSGGSSMELATGCYIGIFLGSLIFLGFVFSLFLKYKSREIGILVSLGISKKSVSKLIKKEINILMPLAVLVGILVSYPIAKVVWSVFNEIMKTNAPGLEIGITGFLVGLVYSLAVILLINYLMFRYMKNFNVIKVMKAEETIEEIKEVKIWFSILGALLIPIGIILFDIFSRTTGIISLLKIPSILLSPIGLYLFILRIPFRGKAKKKKSPQKYYNNIIFYNLLQLKGKEYINTIFLTTIILGFSTFASLFINTQILSMDAVVENMEADYSFSYMKDELKYEKSDIERLAEKNDVKILKYDEFEGIILLEDMIDYDKAGNEIHLENGHQVRAISENTYNKVSGEKIDLKVDEIGYLAIGPHGGIAPEGTTKLTNSVTREEMHFKNAGTFRAAKFETSTDWFYILDDTVYNNQTKTLTNNEKLGQIVFNTDDWRNEESFAKELKGEIITKTNIDVAEIDICYHIADEFNGIKTCDTADQHMEFNLENREINKWWINRPVFKTLVKTESIYDYAVYVLLFMFIAILGFISAGIILYVKSVSSIWKDKKIYQNMSYLGAKKQDTIKIIKKLQRILFIIPTLIGTGVGLIFMGLIGSTDRNGTVFLVIGSIIVVAILTIQFICYHISTKKVVKEVLKFDTL